MKTNPITVEYKGHVITYNLSTDLWDCDVFARGGAETLPKARERIDNAEKRAIKPAKEFERFLAWKNDSYSSERYSRVTVTSVCDSADACWVTDSKGGREKMYVRNLYPVNPRNDAIISELTSLWKQEEAIRSQITSTCSKLKSYNPNESKS